MSERDEARQWRGRWWLPNEEERAVGGDLIFSPSEFTLVLDGSLRKPEPIAAGAFDPFRAVEEPVILGESRSGERVSLLDCEGFAFDLPGATTRTSSWRPSAALLGDHVDARPRFQEVRCEFEYLADWAGMGRPELRYRVEREGQRLIGIDLAASQETLATAELPGARVALQVFPRSKVDRSSVMVDSRVVLDLVLDEPSEWHAITRSWMRPLRDLLSFACVRSAKIESVRLRVPGDEQEVWVDLLLRWIDMERPARSERRLVPQDLLVAARDPVPFDLLLSRWFEVYAEHESAIALLLGVGYAPFIYGDQRFLALAQALEIFHRVAVGGTPLPRQEHRDRVATVSSLIADETLREWAEEILRSANWLKLRQRVEGLIDWLGDSGKSVLGPLPAEAFSNRIVATRNYLTHRDEKRPDVLDDTAQYWYGQAMAWFLRVGLLRELGVDMAEIQGILKRNLSFGPFARQFAELAEV